MSAAPGPRLAVFDLDGTLTRFDTFWQFLLAALARWPARAVRFPLLLGPLLAFAVGAADRGDLKGRILRLLLGGLTRAQLEPVARAFAARVIERGMHAEALAALAAHRAAGDYTVLMSASPDLYVREIGARLGVDLVTCSEVRWKGDRLDGRLAGENCRGHEKARRLATLRERHPGRAVIAYGNTEGDLEHMRLCEEAVYVNPHGKQAADLESEGIRPVHWR